MATPSFMNMFDKLPLQSMPTFDSLNWKSTVNTLRRNFHAATRALEKDAPEMAAVEHLVIEHEHTLLKARHFTPLGAGVGPGPAIVFHHGGGFVVGDIDSHDMICRRLADASRCRVISMSYRLAPENKFPAAHDDAIANWAWVLENAEQLKIDPERLAVCGDSAGGNLSVFITHEAQRRGLQTPAFQLLLYPLLQFADIKSKKLTFQEGGFFIAQGLFEYFRDSYIESEDERMDTRVSPLFADDVDHRALAPAHIVLCGWDPLNDEGRAYAQKLESFGLPVTLQEHPGMVHGFMNLTALSEPVRDAIRQAGGTVGRHLGALE